jgi:hypothetical protein
MKLILIIALILVTFVYLRYYLAFPKDISIIQAGKAAFTPDLLFDKQPVLIDTKSDQPSMDLKSMLRYMYIYDSCNEFTKNTKTCTCAYSAIYSTKNDILVRIVHPSYSKQNLQSNSIYGAYIEVMLKQGQTIILPFMWTYECNDIHSLHQFWDISHNLAYAVRPFMP